MQESKPALYEECSHIPFEKFVNEGDEEFAATLSAASALPPLFERGMFERAFMRHYSLARNERLRCRWPQYVQTVESRQFAPFQLPDVRELHFYNCAIRFLPNESIRHQDHRLKLRPGPGVDNVGQMPIPHEALMKRGQIVKSDSDRRNKMADTNVKQKGAQGKKAKNS